jgi:hypothetical protein
MSSLIPVHGVPKKPESLQKTGELSFQINRGTQSQLVQSMRDRGHNDSVSYEANMRTTPRTATTGMVWKQPELSLSNTVVSPALTALQPPSASQ